MLGDYAKLRDACRHIAKKSGKSVRTVEDPAPWEKHPIDGAGINALPNEKY